MIYFVTICTHKRICYFGNVENGKMILSEIGRIASNHWFEIPDHFPFIELINFVVMPNHIHGLLEITRFDQNPIFPIPPGKNESMAEISPKHGSLSSVMRSYKSAVTKSAHECKYQFAWQPRFHDHIVSGPDEFRRIHDYISYNPDNWKGDKNVSS